MKDKFTLISTLDDLDGNPIVDVVKEDMYKELGEFIKVDPAALEEAYKALVGQLGKEAELLESLMAQGGDDVLVWIPEMLKMPSKMKMVRLFFADAKNNENLIEADIEDLIMEHEFDFDIVIETKEKLRLPKAVIFFWYYAKRKGYEKAKQLLESTLTTIGLHKLMLAKTFSKSRILNTQLVRDLPVLFQAVLREFTEDGIQTGNIDTIKRDRARRVRAAMEGADEEFIDGLIEQAHRDIENVLDGSKTESRTLQYFALDLIKPANVSRVADLILKASPLSHKRSFTVS